MLLAQIVRSGLLIDKLRKAENAFVTLGEN